MKILALTLAAMTLALPALAAEPLKVADNTSVAVSAPRAEHVSAACVGTAPITTSSEYYDRCFIHGPGNPLVQADPSHVRASWGSPK